MFIVILIVLSAGGAPSSTSGCFLWGLVERQWCCWVVKVKEMAAVSEKPHSPFLTGPFDHRAVGLSTGVSALSFAQALLRGNFQPSAIPSAFSLITCTDHFHESGLSHLHQWESRAANPSMVFLQSFQIHCVPCRRLISCASERRIGQHRERTLESGRVGSSPHCTTQQAL